jgi:hypothetical protein
MTTNIYTKLSHIQNEIKETSDCNHLETLKLLNPLLEKHKLTLTLSNDPKSFIREKVDGEHIIRYLKKIEIADKESSNNKLFFNFWAVGGNVDSDKAKTNAENCIMESMLRGLFLV